MYVLPFLIYTSPRLARNVLQYRYSILDKARERAREVSQKGALFPWRTISGEEASAYYAAGTAQYHINAAIAHGIVKYVDVTGDREFLLRVRRGNPRRDRPALVRPGLLLATRQDGRFCIHRVTGPDEYTTVVNNNTYTNLMARENLRFAADAVDDMRAAQPGPLPGPRATGPGSSPARRRLATGGRPDVRALRRAHRGFTRRTTTSSTWKSGTSRTPRTTSTRCSSTFIRSSSIGIR